MEQFDLVFQGKILDGFDLDGVKRNLSSALKASEEKIETLFTGARVRLKKNLSRDQAQKLQQQLARLGAHVDLVPNATPAAPAATQSNPAPLALEPHTPAPVRTAIPDTTPENVDELPPETLRQRLTLAFWTLAMTTLVGIGLMIIFSPYPDGVIKRGLLMGLVITLLAGRKCSQQLRG